MSTYKRTRPRGLAPWRPQAKSLRLLEQVEAVFAEYSAFLPLTLRQIFYRLVAASGYPKSEQAYERLGENLNRARRDGRVPFDSIRDDGALVSDPGGVHGLPGFWEGVAATARGYRRDRLDGQATVVELWVEAAGMVRQLEPVAHPYNVALYSGGGFDSTTVRYEAAQRMIARERPTVVLHVGDFDASGLSIFDAAAADVCAFAADFGRPGRVTFRRVAVTEEQIRRYGLPEAPPKASDRRGGWQGGTVQAEALTPPDLAAEVERSIRAEIDLQAWERLCAAEETERAEAVRRIEETLG